MNFPDSKLFGKKLNNLEPTKQVVRRSSFTFILKIHSHFVLLNSIDLLFACSRLLFSLQSNFSGSCSWLVIYHCRCKVFYKSLCTLCLLSKIDLLILITQLRYEGTKNVQSARDIQSQSFIVFTNRFLRYLTNLR